MKRTGRRRLTAGALLAVVGPGLLAGLSDDDAAGITTYSVLGADHGYQLLWVLLLSTVALILFHGLAARMGVVTGQGLIGLVRQRYGVRIGGATLAAKKKVVPAAQSPLDHYVTDARARSAAAPFATPCGI